MISGGQWKSTLCYFWIEIYLLCSHTKNLNPENRRKVRGTWEKGPQKTSGSVLVFNLTWWIKQVRARGPKIPQLIMIQREPLCPRPVLLTLHKVTLNDVFGLCTQSGWLSSCFIVPYSQESIDDILFSHLYGVRIPANFLIICSGICISEVLTKKDPEATEYLKLFELFFCVHVYMTETSFLHCPR